MTTKLTKLDISRIEECHPLLQKLWYACAKDPAMPEFIIVDGARTVAEQRANIKRGASKTMRSRHLPAQNGWSHATDIAPKVNGKLSWDWKYYHKMTPHIWRIAKELGIDGLEWGGNWKSFKDGPHWQLSWKKYPGTVSVKDSEQIDKELNTKPKPVEGVGNFRKSIPLVLKHEGGYVNHPGDKGGPTNKGITLHTFRRFLKPKGTISDLKALTVEQATDVYKQRYWDAVRADMLPSGVDHFMFDYGVNSGPRKAIEAIQSVIDTEVDGHIGPATLEAVNAMSSTKVIEALYEQRKEYLTNHESAIHFLKGWMKRINRVKKEALSMVDVKADPVKRKSIEEAIKSTEKPSFIVNILRLLLKVLGPKTEK